MLHNKSLKHRACKNNKKYTRQGNYCVKLQQKSAVEYSKAVIQESSVKKVFRKIWQNSQENTCKETLAQVFSFEFCEIFKNTFFYRTSLVAAS